MKLRAAYRRLIMATTGLSHGFQGQGADALRAFYRLWAPIYDISIRFDPAYRRLLFQVVDSVVRPGDRVLDVGCGTGLGAVRAATIAARVLGIDASVDMVARLEKKIRSQGIGNVEVRLGFFPEFLGPDERFDCAFSSFMMPHLQPAQRAQVIAAMYESLEPGGRFGLFSAQGELVSTYERRDEIAGNLAAVGFVDVEIRELADVYRTVTATKPEAWPEA
jgi:cyclopropane fatty-acyl-phospholipid synthase-like methyltransferase